jgi:hypothetical protein
MGGFIHVLLVIAIIVVLVNLISGRKPVWPFRIIRIGYWKTKTLSRLLR